MTAMFSPPRIEALVWPCGQRRDLPLELRFVGRDRRDLPRAVDHQRRAVVLELLQHRGLVPVDDAARHLAALDEVDPERERLAPAVGVERVQVGARRPQEGQPLERALLGLDGAHGDPARRARRQRFDRRAQVVPVGRAPRRRPSRASPSSTTARGSWSCPGRRSSCPRRRSTSTGPRSTRDSWPHSLTCSVRSASTPSAANDEWSGLSMTTMSGSSPAVAPCSSFCLRSANGCAGALDRDVGLGLLVGRDPLAGPPSRWRR